MSMGKIVAKVIEFHEPDRSRHGATIMLMPGLAGMDDGELREFLLGVVEEIYGSRVDEMIQVTWIYLKNPDPDFPLDNAQHQRIMTELVEIWLDKLPEKCYRDMLETAFWSYLSISKEGREKVSRLVSEIASRGIPIEQREDFLASLSFSYEDMDIAEEILREMLGLSGETYEQELEREFTELLQIVNLRKDEEKWKLAEKYKRWLINAIDARGEDGVKYVQNIWDTTRTWESTTRQP